MTRLLLLLSLAVGVSAQTVTITGVDGIGPHSATVYATASSGMTHSKATYSTTDTCAGPSGPNRSYNGSSVTALGNTLGRLKPDTTYYVCVVGDNAGNTYTSASTSFTTTSDTAEHGEPTQPQVSAIPAVNTVYGYTYTLSGCTGAVTGDPALGTATGGIQEVWDHARALASSSSHIKIIWDNLASTSCSGPFTIRARTGGGSGYIDNINQGSTVPPEGIGLDSDVYDTSTWPTVLATSSGPAITGSGVITKWRFIGIRFTNDVPSSAYKTITISGGVRTASGAHGYSVGNIISESDSTGTVRNVNCPVATTPTSTTYTVGTCYTTVGGGVTTSGRTFKDSVLSGAGGSGKDLVNFDPSGTTPSWIIFDRCQIAGTIGPMSLRYGLAFYGTDMYLINSEIKDIKHWGATDPVTLAAVGYGDWGESHHVSSSGSRHTYYNNRNKGAGGITYFIEGGSGTVQRTDMLYRRNRVTWTGYLDRLGLAGGFNGQRTTCRHAFEAKTGENLAYIGNQIEDTFNCGVTGNYAQAFAFSARPADSNRTTSVNQLKNITVKSNKVRRASGFLIAVGGDYDTYTPQSKPTQNVYISNNLVLDVNGRYYCQLDGYVTGAFMRLGGIDNLTVTHNDFFENVGTRPEFINVFGDSITGVLFSGNLGMFNDTGIVNVNASDASQSPALITSGTNYEQLIRSTDVVTTSAAADTKAYIGKNGWVGGVDTSALLPPYTANYAQTGYTKTYCTNLAFANGTCIGAGTGGETATGRISTILFQDYSTGDLRLKPTSPYRASAGLSWDGKDLGITQQQYYKDQGKVSNARITARTSTTISVGYYVHDKSDACYIEYGGTTTYGTGSVVSDGLTGTANRVKQLTGLTPSTSYNVKVVCPSEQYLLSTSTP